MDIRTKDYLTTIIFVVMSLIAFFAAQILQFAPANILGIVTIIVGIISLYVANNRSQIDEAITEAKSWKYVQYLLTAIVILAPFLQLYQPQILASLSPEKAAIAAAIIGIILQFASGKTVTQDEPTDLA